MPEASGQRMNNMGEVNVIILKWSTIKEVKSDYESHTYPVIIATWSQKKNLEAKKFQLMLRDIKPAGRNSERLIANKVL